MRRRALTGWAASWGQDRRSRKPLVPFPFCYESVIPIPVWLATSWLCGLGEFLLPPPSEQMPGVGGQAQWGPLQRPEGSLASEPTTRPSLRRCPLYRPGLSQCPSTSGASEPVVQMEANGAGQGTALEPSAPIHPRNSIPITSQCIPWHGPQQAGHA